MYYKDIIRIIIGTKYNILEEIESCVLLAGSMKKLIGLECRDLLSRI